MCLPSLPRCRPFLKKHFQKSNRQSLPSFALTEGKILLIFVPFFQEPEPKPQNSKGEVIPRSSRSIVVRGLPDTVTEEVLKKHFGNCGSEIVDVQVCPRKSVNFPKWFAFVEFADKKAVTRALALDRSHVLGCSVSVELKSEVNLEIISGKKC